MSLPAVSPVAVVKGLDAQGTARPSADDTADLDLGAGHQPNDVILASLADRLASGAPVLLQPYESRVIVASLKRLADAESEIDNARLALRACSADAAAQEAILGKALVGVQGTLSNPSPARTFDTEPSIRARSRMLDAARRDAVGAGFIGAALRFAASFL